MTNSSEQPNGEKVKTEAVMSYTIVGEQHSTNPVNAAKGWGIEFKNLLPKFQTAILEHEKLKEELRIAIEKGESLCRQNGNLLLENGKLKAENEGLKSACMKVLKTYSRVLRGSEYFETEQAVRDALGIKDHKML